MTPHCTCDCTNTDFEGPNCSTVKQCTSNDIKCLHSGKPIGNLIQGCECDCS